MTRQEFEGYAETYGGDVSRWPALARDGAALLMAAEADFTRQVLARAGRLDAALDAWRPSAASAELRERILEAAPAARRGWRVWLSPAALGAGLAAACAAGIILGVELAQQSAEDQVALTNTLTAVSSLDIEGGA